MREVPAHTIPEPLADFIDVFLIGDGEDQLPQFANLWDECRREGLDKKAFLEKAAAAIDGVYVPAFYDVSYNEDGTVRAYTPNNESAPKRVRRAIVKDIENVDFPVNNIIPFIETVHDRAVVETFRGLHQRLQVLSGRYDIQTCKRKKQGQDNLHSKKSSLKIQGMRSCRCFPFQQATTAL